MPRIGMLKNNTVVKGKQKQMNEICNNNKVNGEI